MRKTCYFWILAVVIFLSACGREKKVPSPSENATPIVQEPTRVPTPVPTQEPTQGPTAIPTEAPTPILTPTPKETIRWVLGFFDKVTEEEQAEINRLLKEKGFDCKIQFIDSKALIDDEYRKWYSSHYGINQNYYDIVSSGGWHTRAAAKNFILDYLLDLTEYMETEEGRAIYNLFAPIDWQRLRIDGKNYLIPSGISFKQNNPGVYISVNDKYSEYFQNFDGTYESLRRIYDEIGDTDMVLRVKINAAVLFSFLGFRTLDGAYPYSMEEHRFIPPSAWGDELNQLMDRIYSDLKSGIVEDPYGSDAGSSSILAEIYYLDRPKKEGYTDYLLTEEIVPAYMSLSYGIAKNCTNKEQVFRVLTFCYTDPDISAILMKSMFGEEWDERMERLKELDVSQYELTGFIPDINPKEYGAVNYYSDVLKEQIESYFFSHISDGKRVLKEERTVTDVTAAFYPKYYDKLFEELNRQAEAYRKNH